MRELWSAIIQTSAARIFSLLAGVVVLFVTARWIGADGRGTVAAITTWVGLFAMLGSLSLGQVAIHRLAVDQSEERLGVVAGSLIAVLAVATVGGWIVAGGASSLRPGSLPSDVQNPVLVVGFALLPFLILEQYTSSLLTAIRELRVYNRYQVIGRGAALVLTVALVGLYDAGVLGVLTAALIGQAVVSCGALAFLVGRIRTAGRSLRVEARELGKLLTGGAKLHLNAIGTFLFGSADVLILHHYRGPAETGQYQLAAQLVGVMMVIPQAASMVLFGSVAAKGPDKAWHENLKLLKHTSGLMVVIGILAGLTAPWWLVILAGQEFVPSVSLFQWLLVSVPGMTFSALLAPQWIGRGFFLQASALTVAVGVLNLGANFYFIPAYGAMGAVFSNLGTFAFSVVGNGVMAVYCSRRARGG
jgi:O-antigen/teichoic acid export membrane protein